jgi:hypothetical protein
LPAISELKSLKPVMLPPGRARLSTKPWPIGSVTIVNTMGIVLVFRRNATTEGLDCASSTSQPSSTSSVA